MKTQWALLLSLVFAVIVAIFAVINVDTVPVNYLFGTAEWPLILVILISALLGFLFSTFVSMFRMIKLNRRVKQLEAEVTKKESIIATQHNEINELKNEIPSPIVIEEQPVIEKEE